MTSYLKYNWPALLWAGFILYLCLLPGRDLPSVNLWQADKLGHFAVYVLLSFLTCWGWKKQSSYNWLHVKPLIKLLVLLSAYGFLVEILQGWLTADRHFDILDATANTIGAIAGSLISVKLLK